jgi:hypothetical protein
LPTPVELVTYPTPTATDARQRFNTSVGSMRCRPNLGAMARFDLWPTLTASDGHGAGVHGQGGMDLRTAVQRFPTPAARDHKGKGYAHQLGTAIGGKLSPMWVEWLMGWPIGWTGLEPLERGRFRRWLESFGKS